MDYFGLGLVSFVAGMACILAGAPRFAFPTAFVVFVLIVWLGGVRYVKQ